MTSRSLVTETVIVSAVSPGSMAWLVASAQSSRLGEDKRHWVDGDVIHAGMRETGRVTRGYR